MRFNSISFKLIGSVLLINTVVLSCLGLLGYIESKNRLSETLEVDTQMLTKRLKLNLPGAIWNFDEEYIDSTLESEAEAHFVKGLYVLDDGDSIISAVVRQGNGLEKASELPNNTLNIQKSPLTFIDPDTDEETPVGKLLIDITDEKHVALLKLEIERIIIQIGALNLILLCLFAITISRMTKPLVVLKNIASSIAKGNYDLSISINRKDEIGDLADSFHVMKTGIQKKIQDLHDLNQIGQDLAGMRLQADALEKALHALSTHTHVKSGSIYLYNKNNMLELMCFSPLKQSNTHKAPRTFGKNEGIMGLAISTSKIIYIPDISKDDRFIGHQEGDTRALICVPLKDGPLTLGALNLSGNVDEVRFEESDFEFAETIAQQLVTTIKNIRMRETIEEQNRTLEQKVEERTAELKQKNTDMQGMLNNMQQGLFTVVDDGIVHDEYSAFLTNVFETDDIAGKQAHELLFSGAGLGSDELNRNQACINSLLGDDADMFEFNSHALTKEYECTVHGNKKILSLDWNAIVGDNDEIQKLMVTVRDVTAYKALELEAEKQKQELEVLGQLASIKSEKYVDFETSAHRFIEENRACIADRESINASTLNLLFRNMHTIKGNARTYGFTRLTDVVHNAETTYSTLRSDEGASWDPQTLLDELNAVEEALNQYDHVHYEILGRGTHTHHASSTSTNSQQDQAKLIETVQACMDAIQQQFPEVKHANAFQPVQTIIDHANTQSLNEILEDLVASLPSLAKDLDKQEPIVKIDAGSVRISTGVNEVINNVFAHLLRNSIDHGIERPEVRTQMGKAAQGRIDIYTRIDEKNDETTLEIHIKDDGAGLNIDKLYERGRALQLWNEEATPTIPEIADLIFHSGLSTKDHISQTSGRGVGMDAVKQFLDDSQCSVSLNLLSEKRDDTPFVAFETVISLPSELFIINPSS